MSLCAILPVANMQAANATLEAQGFGPGNFSVAAYAAPTATHGALHAWNDPAFAAAVKTLPGVAWEESDGNPVTRTQALIAAQGAQWGSRAPDLPVGGDWPNGSHPVTASTLYRWTDDTLWWVIQAHDRAVYGGDPAQYPALIRRVHVPGEVAPWKQPIDQYDAYKLVNPFTGQPDRCTHKGATWYVTQGDGAGNNVWEPGVFGWAQA